MKAFVGFSSSRSPLLQRRYPNRKATPVMAGRDGAQSELLPSAFLVNRSYSYASFKYI
jgi:hypothetical protein